MTLDPTFGAPVAGMPGVRAADSDRERAIDVLRAGFAEGRLTKAEYDERVARVYAARTYGDLGPLIADLPAGPVGGPVGPYPPQYPVRPRVNSAAVGALTCGIGVFLTMGLTGVPAIVLGHSARRQLRETRERGDSLALTGIALGWAGVAILAVFVVGLVAVFVAAHNMHPGTAHPVPGGVQLPVPNPGGPLDGN
jgi:hypothetical protein